MMSRLHIYNPSHEMAMADNSHNFQASKRVVLMEQQLAALPLWWSEDGDSILVTDVQRSVSWYEQKSEILSLPKVNWVDAAGFDVHSVTEICPWGWNKSLWRKLPCLKERELVPWNFIDTIRNLSSRETAVQVLRSFPLSDDWVGESFFCTNEEQIDAAIAHCGQYVLKALWSSSGRGVMLLQSPSSQQARQLCSSFLKHGGGLVIEPQYDKVQDFAMEFWSDGAGGVRFAGYSFFTAEYGRYAANTVAPQSMIRQLIQADDTVLEQIQHHLTAQLAVLLGSRYKGPLGVDMMVVRHEGRLKVQPCVEINLRRNMGWLALTLAERYLAPGVTGRIVSDYQKLGIPPEQQALRNRFTVENHRISSGCLSLTPVYPDTLFQVYLQVD